MGLFTIQKPTSKKSGFQVILDLEGPVYGSPWYIGLGDILLKRQDPINEKVVKWISVGKNVHYSMRQTLRNISYQET